MGACSAGLSGVERASRLPEPISKTPCRRDRTLLCSDDEYPPWSARYEGVLETPRGLVPQVLGPFLAS